MTATSIALIRHGPTAWNAERRIQGLTDTPLSDAGRDAIAAWRLPSGLAAYDWVSSPLARARETAELLGARDLRTDPRLSEMNWGDWEGQRLADLRRDLGDAMADNEARGLDFQPPGGESPRHLLARLTPWLAEVAAAGRATLAITHNGVIRALYARATGWPMTGKRPVEPWGVVHFFTIDGNGEAAVERMNVSLEA